MPPKGHSVCSPSSAKRWIHCPPSAIANANAPRKDTVHTLTGTLAHEFCETKARGAFYREDPTARILELRKHELYDPEIDRTSDRYVDVLLDIASAMDHPYVVLEQQLDFGDIVPDTFGTADCVIMDAQTLHVVDYKHGKGVAVSAEHNEQMMTYALGAAMAYSEFAEFQTVRMSIVQPRIEYEPSTWECSLEELVLWGYEVLQPAAILAQKGEGEYAWGPWCRWCVNEGSCRCRYEDFKAFDTMADKPPAILTDDEIDRALQMAERLDNWVKALKEYAHGRLLNGGEIPGWMLTEGRSVRKFTDQAEAFRIAEKSGIPEEMLYERKPITLTELEKLMGKKQFKSLLERFVEKPKGAPSLCRADSGKRPYTANTIEDDFKIGGNE